MMPDRTSGHRLRTALTRRTAERYPVRSDSFCASWLSDGKKVDGIGIVIDISSGGFGVRMLDAPPTGRLVHATFVLPHPLGGAAVPIEANARVCSASRSAFSDTGTETGDTADGMVHFAIESIHPRFENSLASALNGLKRPAA